MDLLSSLENQTDLVKKYIVKKCDASDNAVVAKNVQSFMQFCVSKILDLNKMAQTDYPFLDLLCQSVFKCSEVPVDSNIDHYLYLQNTREGQEHNKK
ncbi:hypothetical protein PENTCL1PPCAC_25720, partial [Pristionchus entomophagus]